MKNYAILKNTRGRLRRLWGSDTVRARRHRSRNSPGATSIRKRNGGAQAAEAHAIFERLINRQRLYIVTIRSKRVRACECARAFGVHTNTRTRDDECVRVRSGILKIFPRGYGNKALGPENLCKLFDFAVFRPSHTIHNVPLFINQINLMKQLCRNSILKYRKMNALPRFTVNVYCLKREMYYLVSSKMISHTFNWL